MAKIDDSVKKKVPELRFKGFTDEWEERKFADFIDVKSGKDYKHLNSGSIPVYGTGGYMLSVDRALSDIDAIGIGRKGTIDKPYLLKAPFWTVDTLFYAVPKQNIDLQFSLSIFKKINWKKFDESTGVPSLSKTVINSVSVSVPSYEEQQKIGSFFKQLDDTIALHQRKLDLLKEQKKGFLQKMFPKNGAKVPELRFAGFADDWEDLKLSSIAERVTRKNKNNESTLPLTISAQDGLVDQNDYFNKQVASRDVTGYFLVKNGEFAYNKSYSNGYPWGAIKRLDKYEMGVLSTLYIVFKPTAINSQFLVSYYETTRWYREVSKNAAEGARNHGLLNISPNDFFNTLLTIPKSAEEQQQIGSFFKQLDDTIALHQHKLDLLKEQKKGFLQKMFV
ncbi:restriction endonuclease subunit S [Lactococcus lactis]|uniref:restriction endonuclease subunit S n=1 Tax=Lactococcus lactis TaxID=1358 RepID=UPI002072B1A0|nr:restriction endonuclease subunit S [Lactococcus lactis]MCM6847557.1 restriction endonuclease subunit S [Lactococcus lactis]